MNFLLFLIILPFLAALALFVLPSEKIRRLIGYICAFSIIVVSCSLLFSDFNKAAVYYNIAGGIVGKAMLLTEGLITLYVVYMSARYRKHLPLFLSLIQFSLLAYFEFLIQPDSIVTDLFVDRLSLIMAFIIGVIGSLICLYSFGYMAKFHEIHREVKDRRGLFYFILFAFLSAMFGLVFSDNLLWVYFFWETTTMCSFILIAYTQSHEAINNAFHALTMNLIGGLAFVIAIIYLGTLSQPVLTFAQILQTNKAVILFPAALIAFASLTKSAQMPFSSWLVGAMVAPTPVSALLHSSTMVKAGVYILIRFAPIYGGTISGVMLSLIGGLTFLFASGIAISQSNAKKVLAYSTIANLGLIAACAGVGTYEAVWAAILLIIFHALAKSLMFLVVGTVEQRIMSKDIEDMEGLILRMPKITMMMFIGIAGMFLAPFGMLISKWATLKAFIDSNPLLVCMVAFGSGMTVFFWSKWMGKIIAVKKVHKVVEGKVSYEEWTVLYALTLLTIGICLLFPLVSYYLIETYVYDVFGMTTHLSQDNIMIMMLMLTVILMTPFSLLYYRRERRHLSPYMGGRPTMADYKFSGSLGIQRELSLKNYYLEEFFGEKRLLRLALPLCVMLIAAMLILAKVSVPGVAQ